MHRRYVNTWVDIEGHVDVVAKNSQLERTSKPELRSLNHQSRGGLLA